MHMCFGFIDPLFSGSLLNRLSLFNMHAIYRGGCLILNLYQISRVAQMAGHVHWHRMKHPPLSLELGTDQFNRIDHPEHYAVVAVLVQ